MKSQGFSGYKYNTSQKEVIKGHKRIDKLYDKWRDFDILTCFMSMLGLTLAIIDVRIRASK
jgi:uncharacterized membrane protein